MNDGVTIVSLDPSADSSFDSALTQLDGAVCAFGVFDGLHRGHHTIFDEVKRLASQTCKSAIALTFDVDPDELFDPAHSKLMANERRLSELANAGFDNVIAFRFDEDFASIGAEEFLDIAFSRNVPSAIVIGSDFRFGNGGRGDVEMLHEWGATHGMDVVVLSLLEEGGKPVKSTRIRELLSEGNIDEATMLLGHPYDRD